MRTAHNGRVSNGFRQGAGQVRPDKFFDPGLFVTSNAHHWRRFVQGQGYDVGMKPLAAKDLNGPSMAQGQVTSQTSFTREFRATMKGTWKVSVHVPGFRSRTRSTLVSHGSGDRARH